MNIHFMWYYNSQNIKCNLLSILQNFYINVIYNFGEKEDNLMLYDVVQIKSFITFN